MSSDPRFTWHPEPDLIGITDQAASRPALERLGVDAWRTALDYLYDEAFRRAMGEPAGYEELRQTFFGPSGGPTPAPARPTASAELLAEFTSRLAPHQLNAWHPRSLSYFTPPPLWMSIVGEFLAQVTQQGVDVWHAGPSAAFVEEEVVRWLCDLVGYGEGSFGLLTSGGVMANLVALTLARDVHLTRLLELAEPARGRALEDVRVYASDQAHFSIGRALSELGFPANTLHVVASDDHFRLAGAAVAEAIRSDRAAGRLPLAIAAVAGSTNTGSVDRIGELADLAQREGLWLHVDAAYGAAARLSPRDAARVPDLERADSITIDPHKWFFQAYDVGGLLVRRRADLLRTFHSSPEYYRGRTLEDEADPAVAPLNFYQHGIEGTRRWRALKLWLSWKHLGTSGLGRLVEQTNDLARYLARRCAESDDFEVVTARPELSVVCFRHMPGGRATAGEVDGQPLDRHQDDLQAALEASGDGWLSTTRLRDRTWLRAGIVNYLTTEADVDRLLARLRDLASSLPLPVAEPKPAIGT
jgi:glutamate/tyrosine decarboxylase-like PLP-dependent enzyme